MKAALFHQAGEPLVIGTVPDPAPVVGGAVIRVRHCGVCGTDLHTTEQHRDPGAGPVILGHEFAGEIVALGKDAPAGWAVGDRLTSLPFLGCGDCLPCRLGTPWRCVARRVLGSEEATGGFAEYMQVHLNEAVRLPDPVTWQQGALVEPLAVALHAVRRVERGLSGRNILVMGAGPIGLAVVLWCSFFGARHVVVSELDPGRGAMARDFGATGLIDARGDVAAQFRDAAGCDPDLVIECVGVPGMIAQAIDVAPYGAELLIVGFCMEDDRILPAAAMVKELSVRFAIAHDKSDFQFVVDMLAAGRINADRMVTDVVGFSGFPAAFDALRHPASQCKILLDPAAD